MAGDGCSADDGRAAVVFLAGGGAADDGGAVGMLMEMTPDPGAQQPCRWIHWSPSDGRGYDGRDEGCCSSDDRGATMVLMMACGG